MLRKVSKLRLGVTRAHRSLTQGVQAGCEPWLAGTATRIRRSAWLILGVDQTKAAVHSGIRSNMARAHASLPFPWARTAQTGTAGAREERERDPLPGRGSSRSRPGLISSRPRAGSAERRAASCLGGGGRGAGVFLGHEERRRQGRRGEWFRAAEPLHSPGLSRGTKMRGPTHHGPWYEMGGAIDWQPVEPSPALVPAGRTRGSYTSSESFFPSLCFSV